VQVDTEEDETTLEDLHALTRVFVPEQVQEDFAEVRQLVRFLKEQVQEDFAEVRQLVRCLKEQVQEDFAEVRQLVLFLKEQVQEDFTEVRQLVLFLKEQVQEDFAEVRQLVLFLKEQVQEDFAEVRQLVRFLKEQVQENFAEVRQLAQWDLPGPSLRSGGYAYCSALEAMCTAALLGLCTLQCFRGYAHCSAAEAMQIAASSRLYKLQHCHVLTVHLVYFMSTTHAELLSGQEVGGCQGWLLVANTGMWAQTREFCCCVSKGPAVAPCNITRSCDICSGNRCATQCRVMATLQMLHERC
jgi:hypothetical protein